MEVGAKPASFRSGTLILKCRNEAKALACGKMRQDTWADDTDGTRPCNDLARTVQRFRDVRIDSLSTTR